MNYLPVPHVPGSQWIRLEFEMQNSARRSSLQNITALLGLSLLPALWGCSHTVVVPTVLVPVAPRMDLKSYGTIGIVAFSSNSDPSLNSYATQQFQESVQEANPGLPILELGNRAEVLSAVGATQFNADTITRIGKKYGVRAVFLGEIAYSQPKTDVRLTAVNKLEGGVRTEIRGDMSIKLMETQLGASVWSSSAWAKRQISNFSLSTQRGVSASVRDSDPRKDMVPAMIVHLTDDFRPTYVRQTAQ
jgi:hypothetical protein